MQQRLGWIVVVAALVACDGDDGDASGGEDMAATEDGGGGSEADGGSEDGVDSSGDDGGSGIDVAAIMAEAESYASNTKVNAENRASQHALGDSVNVWVAPAVLDAYLAIDPDATGDTASFPAGTYLFKEHLDAEGGFNGLTIMFKAQPGYNTAAGDWWWGRTDAEFNILDQGVVDFCISCHTPAAESDYAFGVPLDNRM